MRIDAPVPGTRILNGPRSKPCSYFWLTPKRTSSSVFRKMMFNHKWRIWIWITAILSMVATGLLLFREEYIQNTLFHQSKIALQNGDLVVAENQLAELLKIKLYWTLPR